MPAFKLVYACAQLRRNTHTCMHVRTYVSVVVRISVMWPNVRIVCQAIAFVRLLRRPPISVHKLAINCNKSWLIVYCTAAQRCRPSKYTPLQIYLHVWLCVCGCLHMHSSCYAACNTKRRKELQKGVLINMKNLLSLLPHTPCNTISLRSLLTFL